MKVAYRAKGRTDKELSEKEKGNGEDSRELKRTGSDVEGRLKAGEKRLGARDRYRIEWKMKLLNTKSHGRYQAFRPT